MLCAIFVLNQVKAKKQLDQNNNINKIKYYIDNTTNKKYKLIPRVLNDNK